MIVSFVMIQEFYCRNTRAYTNIPSCSWKLVFDSSRLQEGIFVYTLVKLYNKANIFALCSVFCSSNLFTLKYQKNSSLDRSKILFFVFCSFLYPSKLFTLKSIAINFSRSLRSLGVKYYICFLVCFFFIPLSFLL